MWPLIRVPAIDAFLRYPLYAPRVPSACAYRLHASSPILISLQRYFLRPLNENLRSRPQYGGVRVRIVFLLDRDASETLRCVNGGAWWCALMACVGSVGEYAI